MRCSVLETAGIVLLYMCSAQEDNDVVVFPTCKSSGNKVKKKVIDRWDLGS